jgi:hypothetical protein
VNATKPAVKTAIYHIIVNGSKQWRVSLTGITHPLHCSKAKIMIYIFTNAQHSFVPYCDEALVKGMIPHHYNLLFYCVPATHEYCILSTYHPDPTHWVMSMTSVADHIVLEVTDLIQKLETLSPVNKVQKRATSNAYAVYVPPLRYIHHRGRITQKYQGWTTFHFRGWAT